MVEQERYDRGAHATESTQDDDDEGLQCVRLAGSRRDRLNHGDHSPCDAGDRRAEAEGDRVRVAQVDADQLRRVTVRAHRLDGQSDAGATEQNRQQGRHHKGDGERRQADVWDDEAAELQACAGVGGGDRAEVGLEDQ